MSILSDNLRYLRTQKNYSQQKIADELNITRGRYAKYEDALSEPPIVILQSIARYFHISIDLLIATDLKVVDMDGILKLDGNRLLLPIRVDRKGENFIEIIPHKAKAGYLSSYGDPEWMEALDHISLPFLKNGIFRAFRIEGDSMPPHRDSSIIIGRYVEDFNSVKDGKTYVLLTTSEGIVYKRVKRSGKTKLLLISDNSFYKPYEVKLSEIHEIWEFAYSMDSKEFEPDDLSNESIKSMFLELKRDIAQLKTKNEA